MHHPVSQVCASIYLSEKPQVHDYLIRYGTQKLKGGA